MKARILKIDNNKALVALLDEKGRCGTGSCGGCSCSTKLKTMRIELPDNDDWKEGDNLTLASQGVLVDALLLLALPLSAAGISSAFGLSVPSALAAGGGLFILAALILRLFRGKKKLTVNRIHEEFQSL